MKQPLDHDEKDLIAKRRRGGNFDFLVIGAGACPTREYSGPYHGFHLLESPDWSGLVNAYRCAGCAPAELQFTTPSATSRSISSPDRPRMPPST
jgi:hypothetical protein